MDVDVQIATLNYQVGLPAKIVIHGVCSLWAQYEHSAGTKNTRYNAVFYRMARNNSATRIELSHSDRASNTPGKGESRLNRNLGSPR